MTKKQKPHRGNDNNGARKIAFRVLALVAMGLFVWLAAGFLHWSQSPSNPSLAAKEIHPTQIDDPSSVRPPEVTKKNLREDLITNVQMPLEPKTLPSKNTHVPLIQETSEPSVALIQYQMEDGLAVLTGDIVLGVPQSPNPGGVAQAPGIELWPGGEIPFHIQPSIENPDRIHAALEMFRDTNLRFLNYEDQEDVLVFEKGASACKSYLGKIGGKQPIFLSPNCSPSDIAHEIMHALGFVHEQNRNDRDTYIDVIEKNIQKEYLLNFQKLPTSLMKMSAAAAFDFKSIMIYPSNMFAVDRNQPTMVSRTNKSISPQSTLSESDVLRIRHFY